MHAGALVGACAARGGLGGGARCSALLGAACGALLGATHGGFRGAWVSSAAGLAAGLLVCWASSAGVPAVRVTIQG